MLKIWLVRLSVLLNILVLGTGLLLWMNPKLVFEPILATLRAQRVDIFESFPLNSSDIVFLGDSITHWAQWDELFPNLPVRNRGIGGDTTTDVLGRLDHVIAGKPRAIFLKIGTNDLTLGPDDRQLSYRQYQEILQRIQSESPQTQIFVQSILPREAGFRRDIEAFNDEIQRMAAAQDIPYIDLYPHFIGEDGALIDEFTSDGIHLTGKGYRQWQTLLQPYTQGLSFNGGSQESPTPID